MTVSSKTKGQNKIDAIALGISKQFGHDTAVRGSLTRALNVIPTGILSLDFALGTGGWPRGYLNGVYGPRDIGKSSIVGLNAIREAQKLDLVPVIIAMEPPGIHADWAMKHGVDPDGVLVLLPESGEEAFAMLHKTLRTGLADLIVFDSIGAVLSESEIAEDGKPRQGGQAGLITWAVKGAAPLAYKHNVCVLMLNQVRDNMAARMPGAVQQPGGNALEHHEVAIVRLRRGKDRYTVKLHGEDVEIGRQVVAMIERNKLTEGSAQKAIFDFYSKSVDGYPFGVDRISDVIATGKKSGVIKQAGSYYDLPNGKRIQGAKGVEDYLEENPAVYQIIREEILKVMIASQKRTVLEGTDEN